MQTKATMKFFVLAAITALASGCAHLNVANVTGAPPAPKMAPIASTSFTKQETLAQAGLTHAKTVWVPFFYTKSGNALYIDGNRVSVPGIGDNVPGFIDAPYGYMAVVLSKSNTSLQVGNVRVHGSQYLYYKLNHEGKIIGMLGSVSYRPHSSVVVAKDAIYIQEERGHLGNFPLYHYVGYNANGNRLTGPSGVLYAAPTSNGGWYLSRVTDTHQFSINCAPYSNNYAMDYNWYKEHNESFVKVRSGSVCYGAAEYYLNPLGAIIVNKPNYASSVRTGTFLQVYSVHHALTSNIDWYITPDNPSNPPHEECWGLIGRKCVQINSGYIAKVGSSDTNMNFDTAAGIAMGSYIFNGSSGIPSWTTQINTSSGFSGALYYGYVALHPGDKTVIHPTFKMLGGFLNNLRNYVQIGSGNDSTYDTQGEYPAINIDAENHIIQIPAGQSDGSGHAVGYDISQKKVLPSQQVLEFLTEYGVQP